MAVVNLRAYGYDAADDDDTKRRAALDLATACFGFAVILDRLMRLSHASKSSAIEKLNVADDIIWFNGMLDIYGRGGGETSERYKKYKMFE